MKITLKKILAVIGIILLVMATTIPAFAVEAKCEHANAYADAAFCPDCGVNLTADKPVSEDNGATHKHTTNENTPNSCLICGELVCECEHCGTTFEITNERCPLCNKKREAVTEEERVQEFVKNTKASFIVCIVCFCVGIIAAIIKFATGGVYILNDIDSLLCGLGGGCLIVALFFGGIHLADFITVYNMGLLF